jgi:TatA/E family protein of Tat protein translocase
MGPLGWPETVFIVLLALLLFGPKKLPELGRMLGKAITEFRKASSELRSTFDREMRNLEREAQALKETAVSHYQDSYNYDNSSYDSGAPYSSDTPALSAAATAPGAITAGTTTASHSENSHPTEGVSAPEGALLTTAEPSRAPAVIPAPGTIASGSLASNTEHALNVAPGPVHDLDQSAAQETLKS